MIGKLIEFPHVSEDDGGLTYMEGKKEIPFEIKRCFYIYNVPENERRANHASVTTDFVLIAMNGSVCVELNTGKEKTIYTLTNRNCGLYVPKNTWMVTRDFTPDAVLLVLASTDYKSGKYMDDYQEFLKQGGSR